MHIVYFPALFVLASVQVAAMPQPNVAPQGVPVYHVRRASAQIRVDGTLDEWDWIAAERLRFLKFSHDPEDSKPLREETMVTSLWDDQNLYIGFIIQDHEIWATIRKRDARLFPEECVEFYLDPDSDGRNYIEAQFNSVGNIRDLLVDGNLRNPSVAQFDEMARWNFRHLKKQVRIYRDGAGRDIGWTLEIAIPWSEFCFSRRTWPPRSHDELRINFYRYERSRDGKLPLELSGWSPAPGDWHDPAWFGRFIFESSPVGQR